MGCNQIDWLTWPELGNGSFLFSSCFFGSFIFLMASSFTQRQVALCRTCSCLVSRLTTSVLPPWIQTPTGRIRGRRSVDPRCALQKNIRELVYSVPHSRSHSAVSNKGKSITLAGPTNVVADLRKCMSAWKMDSANSSMRSHRAVNTRLRADSQMLCV